MPTYSYDRENGWERRNMMDTTRNARWESLEQWAMDEILKIVSLRNGRMDGPPMLDLRDFIGKRLRVRYEILGTHEIGTFSFTITSIQIHEAVHECHEIVFGIAPHEVPLARGGSIRFDSVQYVPRRDNIPNIADVSLVHTGPVDEHGRPVEHEFTDLVPVTIHVLWS